MITLSFMFCVSLHFAVCACNLFKYVRTIFAGLVTPLLCDESINLAISSLAYLNRIAV